MTELLLCRAFDKGPGQMFISSSQPGRDAVAAERRRWQEGCFDEHSHVGGRKNAQFDKPSKAGGNK